MPVGKIQIEIQGLKVLQTLLKGNELYAGPWKEGMERLAEKGGHATRGGAPYRTGRLHDSVRTAVQKRPFPQWAAIRVRAVSKTRSTKYPRGYAYPRLLEFSPKHGHRGWMARAMAPVIAGADRVLEEIGRKIATKWTSLS